MKTLKLFVSAVVLFSLLTMLTAGNASNTKQMIGKILTGTKLIVDGISATAKSGKIPPIRSCANAKCDLLEAMKAGLSYPVLGKAMLSKKIWFAIQRTNGATGWVYGSNVDINGNVSDIVELIPPPVPTRETKPQATVVPNNSTSASGTEQAVSSLDCSKSGIVQPDAGINVNKELGNTLVTWNLVPGADTYIIYVYSETYGKLGTKPIYTFQQNQITGTATQTMNTGTPILLFDKTKASRWYYLGVEALKSGGGSCLVSFSSQLYPQY